MNEISTKHSLFTKHGGDFLSYFLVLSVFVVLFSSDIFMRILSLDYSWFPSGHGLFFLFIGVVSPMGQIAFYYLLASFLVLGVVAATNKRQAILHILCAFFCSYISVFIGSVFALVSLCFLFPLFLIKSALVVKILIFCTVPILTAITALVVFGIAVSFFSSLMDITYSNKSYFPAGVAGFLLGCTFFAYTDSPSHENLMIGQMTLGMFYHRPVNAVLVVMAIVFSVTFHWFKSGWNQIALSLSFYKEFIPPAQAIADRAGEGRGEGV